jgi:thiamine pyrophosphokinase
MAFFSGFATRYGAGDRVAIMGKVVFVVSGGVLGDPAFLRQQVALADPAALIAADGGARHLEASGLTPDVIVGDMDSLAGDAVRRYEALGCRIVRHPGRKDETDTELALGEAFAMEPDEVWIWGALGHRVDHTLANLALLVLGAERGIEVKLIDSWCEVLLIRGRKVLDGREGQTVSLLPLAGEASGITLTGFEYPLRGAVMGLGHPYGISNRLAATRGIIEVEAGCLIAVRYFDPGVFPGEERG